ncbi:WAT1-related protein [Raphanus sativus]|nr:WAT1-related protein [Raphanus sativus]
MALTSATFTSAMANLIPAITFIVGISVRLERLEFGTAVGKAKVFGTLVGIGGAMLFTFYKGFSIDFLKSNIKLLPGTSTGHVALLPSDHHVLGACLALISCFSYSIWIIIQAKMSETFPCHYASTGNSGNSISSITNFNLFEGKGSTLCSHLQPPLARDCRLGWCFVLGRKALLRKLFEHA